VLISGYLQWGQDQEALNCFEQVESEGLSPDVVTFIGVLKACGSTGAIDKGKQIHKLIIDRSLLQRDILLGTALVDMYAKCGMLVNAKEVLEDLPIRNAVVWSALIAGYSQQQQVHNALIGLEQMQNEGFSPNDITVLSVLSACSHVGLLDVARSLFRNMTTNYGITPNLEHHTCMVMTFGCVGHFDEAVSVVKAMPSDYCAVWLALLGACKKWGNVKLGALAFDQVIQLDYTCAAAYVFMANIFSAAGMKEDEEKIKSMRLQFSTPSKLGNSDWVDGVGNIHLFSTEDKSHVQSKAICGELKPDANEMFDQGFSQTTRFTSRSLIG
jgi:pentatricopeptide repeat protein